MYWTKFSLFLLILFSFSCKESEEKIKKTRIEIQGAEFNYVWKKSDWCRTNNIYLFGKFYNDTDSIVQINFIDLSSFCNFDKQGNFEIVLNDKKYNGIAIKSENPKQIKVGDSLNFKIRLQKSITDDEELYFNAANWIKNSSNKIGIYIHNSDTTDILKSDYIKYNFLLDDNDVITNDSLIKLYKTKKEELFKYYKEEMTKESNES